MRSTTAPPPSGRARLAQGIHGRQVLPAPDAPPVTALAETGPAADEQDRAELTTAVAMVAKGFAVRVVISGLQAPEAAAAALAFAAADRGVTFELTPTAD